MLSSLSVVIPAYNEEENLEDALNEGLHEFASIATDVEIIIVNDGSIDKTQEIAEKFAGQDKRIRIASTKRTLVLGKLRSQDSGVPKWTSLLLYLQTGSSGSRILGYMSHF